MAVSMLHSSPLCRHSESLILGAQAAGGKAAVTVQNDGLFLYDVASMRLIRTIALGGSGTLSFAPIPAAIDPEATMVHAVLGETGVAASKMCLVSQPLKANKKSSPSTNTTLSEAQLKWDLPQGSATPFSVLALPRVNPTFAPAVLVLSDGSLCTSSEGAQHLTFTPSSIPASSRLRASASLGSYIALLSQQHLKGSSTPSPKPSTPSTTSSNEPSPSPISTQLLLYRASASKSSSTLNKLTSIPIPFPSSSSPTPDPRVISLFLTTSYALISWTSGAVTLLPGLFTSPSFSHPPSCIHIPPASPFSPLPPPTLPTTPAPGSSKKSHDSAPLQPGTPSNPSGRKRKGDPSSSSLSNLSSPSADSTLLVAPVDDTQFLMGRLAAVQSSGNAGGGAAVQLQYTLIEARYGCVMSVGAVPLEGITPTSLPPSSSSFTLAPPVSSNPSSQSDPPPCQLLSCSGPLSPPLNSAPSSTFLSSQPSSSLYQGGASATAELLCKVGGDFCRVQVQAPRASLLTMLGKLALGGGGGSTEKLEASGKLVVSSSAHEVLGAAAGAVAAPGLDVGGRVEGVVKTLDMHALAMAAQQQYREQVQGREKGGEGTDTVAEGDQRRNPKTFLSLELQPLPLLPSTPLGPPQVGGGGERGKDPLGGEAAAVVEELRRAVVEERAASPGVAVQGGKLILDAFRQQYAKEQQERSHSFHSYSHPRHQSHYHSHLGRHMGPTSTTPVTQQLSPISHLPADLIPLTVMALPAELEWVVLEKVLAVLPPHSLTGCPQLVPILAHAQQYRLIPMACSRVVDVPGQALVEALKALITPTTPANLPARRQYRKHLRSLAEQVVTLCEAHLSPSANPALSDHLQALPSQPSSHPQGAPPSSTPPPSLPSSAPSFGRGQGRSEERDRHSLSTHAALVAARCAAACVDGWAQWEVALHAPLALVVDGPALQAHLRYLSNAQVDSLLSYLSKWATKHTHALGDLGSLGAGSGRGPAQVLGLPVGLTFPGLAQVLEWTQMLMDTHLPRLLMAPRPVPGVEVLQGLTKLQVDACQSLLPLQGVVEHVRSGAPLPSAHIAAASLYTVQYIDLGIRGQ